MTLVRGLYLKSHGGLDLDKRQTLDGVCLQPIPNKLEVVWESRLLKPSESFPEPP